MVIILTVLIMLVCGYAQYRNGLFTSCAMLMAVLMSSLIAFGFWEPIADLLDGPFQASTVAGCEDMIVLVGLFAVALLALRIGVVYLVPDLIEEHGVLQHFGGAAVGLVTGYFVAGFLLCAMQTLPLDERFMDFSPRTEGEPAFRAILPGDRVLLSMMRHAGASPFAWKEIAGQAGNSNLDRYATFDRNGTFELRYLRYRRSTDTRPPMPYFGEFDQEIGKKRQ